MAEQCVLGAFMNGQEKLFYEEDLKRNFLRVKKVIVGWGSQRFKVVYSMTAHGVK